MLALGNLDDLLDQAGANLAFQIRNPVVIISIWSPVSRWPQRGGGTYASIVYCGSGANTVGEKVRSGL